LVKSDAANENDDLARIIHAAEPIEAQPFRSEGMPFGIAHAKGQIPDLPSAI
jgi:hypothetical protein